MTARGVALAIAVAGLWTGARTFGVPELQSLAVAALTVLVAAVLWAGLLPTSLSVHRTVRPTSLAFGDRATAQLTVTNTGWLPTPPLYVADAAPATLVQRSQTRLAPIGPGRSRTVAYEIVGRHRGRATLGPVTVWGRDAFGLAQRTRRLPGTSEVVVLPRVVALPPGLRAGGATGSTTSGRSRPNASGDELSDIREYVHGEDLRAVHWPSTAHRGKLMVRRKEDVLTPRATVVLDVRSDRHRGHGPGASIEAAITAAASAARHFDENGRHVVVLDRPVRRAPEALAATRWLERLAETEPTAVDLDGLLGQLASGVTNQGTLLAVVTTPQDHELRELVRAGRSTTSRLALIVDAATFAGARPDPDVDRAVAGLVAAGWRATGLRRGDDLADNWRALVSQGRRHGVGAG